MGRNHRWDPKEYLHVELTEQIVGACIEVHRVLGPGYVEPVYRKALLVELGLRGLAAKSERKVGVLYKDVEVGTHRYDVLVEDKVVIELKSVEALHSRHQAQLVSTLKALGLEVGLLANFNVAVMKDGIKRVAASHPGRSRR